MLARRRDRRRPTDHGKTRRARKAVLGRSLESLEGRALLSVAALVARPHVVEASQTPRAALIHARWQAARPIRPAYLNHGPLNQKIVGGHVSKAPQFYSEYRGPRLPELNGIGAMGQLVPGVGYVFTGRVVGPINPTRTADYVFGVDRGGASAATTTSPPTRGSSGINFSGGKSIVSFPRRPNLFADALVTVTVGPGGTQGAVRLMGQDQGTPLPPGSIQVNGQDVTVVVPPSLLPPNGLPADRFAYAFWTRSGTQGPADVASFVPEYNVTRIGFHA